MTPAHLPPRTGHPPRCCCCCCCVESPLTGSGFPGDDVVQVPHYFGGSGAAQEGRKGRTNWAIAAAAAAAVAAAAVAVVMWR